LLHLFYFPISYCFGFARKANAQQVCFFAFVRFVITSVFDLLQRIFCRVVEFELKNTDAILVYHDRIDSAGGNADFCLNKKSAEFQRKENDGMKIFFLMLVKYFVRNGCEKRIDRANEQVYVVILHGNDNIQRNRGLGQIGKSLQNMLRHRQFYLAVGIV